MTLDEFAAITQRVIAAEGFEEFQPTACYPARCEVKTLAGLPATLEPELPVLNWAGSSISKGEEFLVAFKVDGGHFKVIRRMGTVVESEMYAWA